MNKTLYEVNLNLFGIIVHPKKIGRESHNCVLSLWMFRRWDKENVGFGVTGLSPEAHAEDVNIRRQSSLVPRLQVSAA